MAYKVGDKVRIVDHRADNMNHSGEMDKRSEEHTSELQSR